MSHQQTAVNVSYPGKYFDRFGEVPITIVNDGHMLRTTIREVDFQGNDFDCLSPAESTPPEKLASFTFQHNDLCCCTIECDIPIPVADGQHITEGLLHLQLELGEPMANGSIDRETLRVSLLTGEKSLTGSGGSGWFEDELLELQAALPQGTFLKACINCAFSDYHPAGHGLFGSMACFRENKQEYLSVKTKADIFRVWDTLTEYVQETYLCPEFQRRPPGTGYRG